MISAAALGAVLLAVVVVANWSTVNDHVEAWLLQRGRVARVERDARQIYRAAWEYRTQRGDWPRTVVEILEAENPPEPGRVCTLGPLDPWTPGTRSIHSRSSTGSS